MSFDQRALRNAFGCFATGVTIVTTKPGGADPIGITANSFSSVSLDPPLVLWCLDKGSDTVDIFEATDNYAINVLAADQMHLSNHYAKTGGHQMLDGEWTTAKTGAPLIKGALAHFDCEIHARHDAGDHIIMVGHILHFDQPQEGKPLLYCLGGYQELA